MTPSDCLTQVITGGGGSPPEVSHTGKRKMNVRITYADQNEIDPTEKATPYRVKFAVEGGLEDVANWIEEHLEIFQYTVNGLPYTQGADLPYIIEQLRDGGIQSFGDIAYKVEQI